MRSFTNPEHRTHLDLSTLKHFLVQNALNSTSSKQERIELEGGSAGAVYSSPTSYLGKRAIYCRVISPCMRSFQSKNVIVPNKPYPYRPLSQKEGPPIKWRESKLVLW